MSSHPCRFCRGEGGGRRPCAEGADRCKACLERLKQKLAPIHAPGFSVGVGLELRDGVYVVAGHPDGKIHSDAISVATPRKPEGT